MSEIVEVMARATCCTSHIQGFLYGGHHVIRDLRKPPGQQEIFRASIADCGDEQWAEECNMARRRVEMQAVLTALDAAGFAIVRREPEIDAAMEGAKAIAEGIAKSGGILPGWAALDCYRAMIAAQEPK